MPARAIVDEAHTGATAQKAPKGQCLPTVAVEDAHAELRQSQETGQTAIRTQRIRAVLPRYRELDDGAILSTPFALADAQELIACELGFDSWEALRTGDGETQTSAEKVNGHEPLLWCFPLH